MDDEIKKEESGELAEEKEGDKKDDQKAPEKPLEKMTAPELRDIAKSIEGVTGVHAMKKEDLLKLIKEDRGIKDDERVKPKKKKGKTKEITVKDLKKKILQAKKERVAALQEKDKNRIDISRRRINRLKKMTRKVARA